MTLAAMLLAWGALGITLPPDTPLGPQTAALICAVPQLGMILLAAMVVQGRFRAQKNPNANPA